MLNAIKYSMYCKNIIKTQADLLTLRRSVSMSTSSNPEPRASNPYCH